MSIVIVPDDLDIPCNLPQLASGIHVIREVDVITPKMRYLVFSDGDWSIWRSTVRDIRLEHQYTDRS